MHAGDGVGRELVSAGSVAGLQLVQQVGDVPGEDPVAGWRRGLR